MKECLCNVCWNGFASTLAERNEWNEQLLYHAIIIDNTDKINNSCRKYNHCYYYNDCGFRK